MDITLHNVRKTYGRKVAVDGLSFRVEPGQVTGFLGPNGAGKSTTMRMIMGLDRPNSGSATIGGRRYADLDRPLRQVGALLESGALHPGRSARDHLLSLAHASGIPRRRVDEVLEMVGLAEVGNKHVKGFSLGMGQRLGLAVALLGDPGVLILDEPVNGLDVEGVRWVRELLRTLASEGRTILLSSHLLSEMAMTADHLIVINGGQLVADSPTTELLDQGSARFVRIGSSELDQLLPALRANGGLIEAEPADSGTARVTGLTADAIGAIARDHQLALRELVTCTPSLEETFVELMARPLHTTATETHR